MVRVPVGSFKTHPCVCKTPAWITEEPYDTFRGLAKACKEDKDERIGTAECAGNRMTGGSPTVRSPCRFGDTAVMNWMKGTKLGVVVTSSADSGRKTDSQRR